ncbi:cation-transporting ATPase [Curtobacterium sp. NPDC098951]|uniref:cation-transporting ATPase n=1 Tax=Curtobacterium sp. NPDC098951 TaxID=3363974 RepID=UPI0037FE40B0
MANLNRIIGMAGKVIDKQLQKRGQVGSAAGAGQQQGGSDWRDIVRNAADRLTGDDRSRQSQQHGQQYGPGQSQGQAQYGQAQPQDGRSPQGHVPSAQPAQPQRGQVDPDQVAIAKYDYLLRTAPPEQLEQVHHDAFARLTPGQRQQIRDRLNSELPPHEHLRDDSAGGMARAMTRGEVARPGLVRRVLGGAGSAGRGRGGAFAGGAAVGAGAMALGGLGAAVAGGAVLSAAAGPVLAEAANLGVDFEGIASGFGDLGLADLGGGVEGIAGEGEQLLGGLGEQVSGLGEQASNLGNDFLGGLFDR